MHRLKLFEMGEEKMSLKEATEKRIPINTLEPHGPSKGKTCLDFIEPVKKSSSA